MGSLWLSLLLHAFNGHCHDSAVRAIDKAPVNARAQRYRLAALYLFLLSAGLILTAALVDSFVADGRTLSEVFGWSGLAGFQCCTVCGIRYGSLNGLATCSNWPFGLLGKTFRNNRLL
jgi:hypothetical protein